MEALRRMWSTLTHMFEVRGAPEVAAALRQVEPLNRSHLEQPDALDHAVAGVRLVWRQGSKFGTAELRQLLEDVAEDDHLIIVCENMTVTARKELFRREGRTELFKGSELVLDIMNHVWYRKHIHVHLCTEQEVRAVCGSVGGADPDMQFPKMTTEDPVARYFGAVPGDVFRITRKWVRSAPEHITYRVIIPAAST